MAKDTVTTYHQLLKCEKKNSELFLPYRERFSNDETVEPSDGFVPEVLWTVYCVPNTFSLSMVLSK